MAAFVEHDFERGFLLDEERLRKIHDLIESRTSKFPTPLSPKYKIFRGDSYSFETNEVAVVAAEDNDDWRAITKLEVLVRQVDVFDFKLSFSKNGLVAEITGDDRDAVYLLFSDLREYIQNEVLVGRSMSRDSTRTMGLVVMFLITMGIMYSTFSRSMVSDADLVTQLLATDNINDKLNFLIEEKKRTSPGMDTMAWFGLLMLAAVLGPTGALQAAWKAIFPSNVFLFGRRKATFEKRRRIVSNLFWVVAVGLVVSSVAGLLVWRLTG